MQVDELAAKTAQISEFSDAPFEIPGDALGSRIRRVFHGLSDLHHHSSREPLLLISQFEQTVDPYREHRKIEFVRQQPDTRLERLKLAGVGAPAFWKNDDAVSAIDGFAGKRKALAKSVALKDREHVEERNHQTVVQFLPNGLEPVRSFWRMAHARQELSQHS